MPVRKIVFVSNEYYHIYNRGHNKQNIFIESNDYMRYIKRLKDYLKKHQVSIIAYCLMPNHIHLLIRQDADQSLKEFIHRLHTAYTMYFNKRYDRVGSVFQGRFQAKHIDSDEYLLHISRYIHQNPLEILPSQGRALNLKKYLWSSYPEYIGKSNNQICKTSLILNYFSKKSKKNQVDNYITFVEEGIKSIDSSTLKIISEGAFHDILELKARP